MAATPNVIFGRSSSHFTRVTRIFAEELRVPYSLEVVRDLLSTNADDYGGNPALKVPVLRTGGSTLFGALNICRELARQSARGARIVWPEDLTSPLLANAQELIAHAMSAEVGLVMHKVVGGEGTARDQQKRLQSLLNSLAWLERHLEEVVSQLAPNRDVSYLEVTLHCLIEHLEFRNVVKTDGYTALRAFAAAFGQRESAKRTPYVFDR